MSSDRARSALVLRHDPIIGLGNLESTLREHGYDVHIIDTPLTDVAALDSHSADLLVVLGGEEGAYEGDTHPYIAAEIDLLRRRIADQAPVFGVCLGAQLLAAALDAPVYKGPVKEIGYVTVTPTEAGLDSPVRHFAGVAAMEWHGDTFDLPEGVTHLASSETYGNQAFSIGQWLLAVQFHPEVTDAIHEDWVQTSGQDLLEVGQTPESARAERVAHSAAQQEASRLLLGEFLERLPAREPAEASAGS
ncbi:glutamine amidotransferase [Rathayibacter sp. YIM 133350]|uniref:glutamine amidotransferase-related protein n=1 Tax=Rathayibacter sp. YIM 133350 TaxID=3131992 RepID=UPI00307D17F0